MARRGTLLPFPPPSHMNTPTRYAGFWTRVVAAIIDAIIIGIAGSLVGMLFGGPENSQLPGLLSMVIAWLYGAYQESSKTQATIGKRIMGLVVTDMQGKRLTFLNATGRHFAKYISAIILCIGYLMVAFTPKKQGLHDMIAGTLVVRA